MILSTPVVLLKKSLSLFRAQFWTLLGYSAWLLIPNAAYILLSTQEQTKGVLFFQFFVTVVDISLVLWVTIGLVTIVNEIEQKQNQTKSFTQKEVWQKMTPLVFAMFLQSLFVFFGFVLLIIPGIICMIWYAFVQHAVILDGKKGMQALQFSHALVRGRFVAVLLRVLLGPLLIALGYSIVVGVMLSFLGFVAGFDPAKLLTATELPAWMQLIISVVDILIIPLIGAYFTLLYLELKKTSSTYAHPGNRT